MFVVDAQKRKTLTGEVQCTLRLCVVVKRKLLLFYWKNREFHEFDQTLSLPDTPRMIAWTQESLCLGLRSEYSLIKVTGDPKELFTIGDKHPEPLVVLLSGNRFALGRNENTYFLDAAGSPILKYPIAWSEIPISLTDDPPYLVSVLPSSFIEVRTIEPKLLIQKIDLKDVMNGKAKLLIKCTNKCGQFLVASSTDVFCAVQVPLRQQIPQLLTEKHFELAEQLANMKSSFDTTDNLANSQRNIEINRIQCLRAFDLFCKKQYKEALGLFLKLKTDPCLVIGLYPDLLPEEFRRKLDYPSNPPNLQGNDLEDALVDLVEYLLEIRRNHTNPNAIGDASESITYDPSKKMSKFQIRQIIDTTLLKCYLQTNDALVAPLLRLPDSHCNLEEVEKALKKYHKYNELIILYNSKGLHKKALDLLQKQSRKVDSPLGGHERTIQYLQHLGMEHLSLIFEYAAWVLKEHPEDGLKIFTDDITAETEQVGP